MIPAPGRRVVAERRAPRRHPRTPPTAGVPAGCRGRPAPPLLNILTLYHLISQNGLVCYLVQSSATRRVHCHTLNNYSCH